MPRAAASRNGSARRRSISIARCASSICATPLPAVATLLSPAARTLLSAYARGVNAYIGRRGRLAAPEFLLLGRPEPWSVDDSLLWGEWLAYSLSGNGDVKLERLAMESHLPAAKILQLWPSPHGIVPPQQAVLDPTLEPTSLAAAAAARLASWPRYPAPFTEPKTASNEFAVSAARSTTGAPLLAGDPHLGFNFPGLWYLVRIDTPEQTLAGATGPGAPFIVFGHNRDIAWTFTNNGADVQDIFIEHAVSDPKPGPVLYATPSGPMPFAVRHETILVKGPPPSISTSWSAATARSSHLHAHRRLPGAGSRQSRPR